MAPHIANFLLGSFGIVGAILLIGGSIALRWQKNRQRYDLMRRSLETGTPLPEGTPLWIASRRQALSTLALGAGLILVGGGAWRIGSSVSAPTSSAVALTAATQSTPSFGADLRAPLLPSPNPELEQWHSAQERVAVGQTALGCGIILILLGVVQLRYSAAEKRFANSQDL